MADANEKTNLPRTKEEQKALFERLLDAEAGGQLAEADVREVMMQRFGDRAREAGTLHVDPAPHARADLSSTAEVAPEVLAKCLKGLEADYKRGIVVVTEEGTVDHFQAAFAQDKTAGTSLEQVRARLTANDSALLKKAARMQGGGELIGVDTKGELVIISRADKQGNREPERFGFRAAQIEGTGDQRKPRSGEKPILINTDMPNREALMAEIGKSGLFADYWERRNAVHADGFTLPPDPLHYEKKGIVAAVEAVTGKDFVHDATGKEWRSADLDCGDVSRSALVRVVRFGPFFGNAGVRNDDPEGRDDARGAVRVLRG